MGPLLADCLDGRVEQFGKAHHVLYRRLVAPILTGQQAAKLSGLLTLHIPTIWPGRVEQSAVQKLAPDTSVKVKY